MESRAIEINKSSNEIDIAVDQLASFSEETTATIQQLESSVIEEVVRVNTLAITIQETNEVAASLERQ